MGVLAGARTTSPLPSWPRGIPWQTHPGNGRSRPHLACALAAHSVVALSTIPTACAACSERLPATHNRGVRLTEAVKSLLSATGSGKDSSLGPDLEKTESMSLKHGRTPQWAFLPLRNLDAKAVSRAAQGLCGSLAGEKPGQHSPGKLEMDPKFWEPLLRRFSYDLRCRSSPDRLQRLL